MTSFAQTPGTSEARVSSMVPALCSECGTQRSVHRDYQRYRHMGTHQVDLAATWLKCETCGDLSRHYKVSRHGDSGFCYYERIEAERRELFDEQMEWITSHATVEFGDLGSLKRAFDIEQTKFDGSWTVKFNERYLIKHLLPRLRHVREFITHGTFDGRPAHWNENRSARYTGVLCGTKSMTEIEADAAAGLLRPVGMEG